MSRCLWIGSACSSCRQLRVGLVLGWILSRGRFLLVTRQLLRCCFLGGVRVIDLGLLRLRSECLVCTLSAFLMLSTLGILELVGVVLFVVLVVDAVVLGSELLGPFEVGKRRNLRD